MEIEEEKNKKNAFWETLKFVILSIVIVVPIRVFVAQPFIVSGSSMYPTFNNGDYLIVDELSYRLGEIRRNDVVIFRYPEEPSKFFIKRIIGLPNETVSIQQNIIKIIKQDGEQIILNEPFIENQLNDGATFIELKDEEYFVMGDNRNKSSDSRYWGPVKRNLIIGQAYLRLFPINNISYKPGDFK
jgi:signal peptidase I